MNRKSTLLLATLLVGAAACSDKDAGSDKAKTAEKTADADTPDAPDAEPEEAEDTPEAEQARTVASGLDVGQKFAAFDIINCESGDKYCQVCKYGPNPKIMAVGTIDDEDFKQDLKDLDALVKKFGDDKLKAFAVIADASDAGLVTPVDTAEEIQAKADALRKELGLSMPVVIPAPKGEDKNGIFEEHYKVSKSRTIMFADGKNQVRYSEVAPADKAKLESTIKEVLG